MGRVQSPDAELFYFGKNLALRRGGREGRIGVVGKVGFLFFMMIALL